MIRSGAAMMVDEIMAQKQLTAAENEELAVDFQPLDSLRLIKRLAKFYSHHKTARGKSLAVEDSSAAVEFVTDKALLSRVLGNMIKNALEASETGRQATVGCFERDGKVIFQVRNPGVIPPETRMQIFQRSFSTKSGDRGLGTYSMKLLGEKYLEGKISFVSDRENGTVFTARFPVRPMQGSR
jgi:signal transduction histidine kinase